MVLIHGIGQQAAGVERCHVVLSAAAMSPE